MTTLPTGLVISDFPIVGKTAVSVLSDSYFMSSCAWQDFLLKPGNRWDLLIVDVTTMDTETAMSLFRKSNATARIAVCSLHQNEVQVYRLNDETVTVEAALPNLFSLAA